MTTLATQQLSLSPVIGLRNGQPVTAIRVGLGHSRPQLVGSVLYVPRESTTRLDDSREIVVDY